MTFDDYDNEQPVSLIQFLVTLVLAAAAVAVLMFFSGCLGAGGGDDDTQTQTITIVSGNDLSVDCSDSSTVAAEEEDDEPIAVGFNDTDSEDIETVDPQFANVPVTGLPPIVSGARVRDELLLVQSHGLLLSARIQECNGGQIIANGVDANVDVQIDDIEEITGEGALVRVLMSSRHFPDGPSDFEEVLGNE